MTESNLLTITAGDKQVVDVALQYLTDAQMSGASVKFTVRWRTDSPDWLAQYTVGAGLTINVGPSLTLVVQPADFAWIKKRTGLVYAIVVTPNDGSGPVTVAEGRLLVNPSV